MNGSNPYISLSEAGKISGYTAEYLRQLCVKGKLEGVKIGKSWVTTEAAVTEFKARQSGEPLALDQVVGTSVFSYSKAQKLAAIAMAVLVFFPVAANLSRLSDRVASLKDKTNQLVVSTENALNRRISQYIRQQLQELGIKNQENQEQPAVAGSQVENPISQIDNQNPQSAKAVQKETEGQVLGESVSNEQVLEALRTIIFNDGLPQDLKLALKGEKGDAGAAGITTIISSATIPNSGSVFGTTAPTAPQGSAGTIGSATYLSSREFHTETLTVTSSSSLHTTTIDGDLILSGDFSLTGPATITGDLLPGTDDLYALGSLANRWNSLRVGTATSSFAGDVGIGTTDPTGKLNILSTAEQLRLSYDDSNFASMTIGADGNITVAPSGGRTTLTGATGLVLSGNDADITFSGTGNHDITATGGTLRIGSNTIIGNVEALDDTVDIGTPATRFDKIYANEVNASTLVGTISGGNVSAETLSINSDNATADGEDSFLAFERGSVSPNALLQWNSASDRFDFNSGVHITNTIGSAYALSALGGDIVVREDDDGNEAVRLSADNTSGTLDLYNNGGLAATRITSNGNSFITGGNVGIGTTNSNITGQAVGSTMLTVQGTGTGLAGHLELASQGSVLTDNSSLGTVHFTNGSTRIARIVGRSALTSGDSGYLAFNTTNAGNDNERMRISYDGNVGIGTTTPSAKLHLNYGNTIVGPAETLRLEVTGNVGVDRGPLMTFYAPNNSGTSKLVAGISGTLYPTAIDQGGALLFSTNTVGGSALVERMRIDHLGNVGIGTTNPTSQLSLYNTSDARMRIETPTTTKDASITYLNGDTSWTTGINGTNNSGLFTIARASGFGSNNFLNITTAGNVGIGTTNPGTPIHIYGNGATYGANIESGAASASGLKLTRTTSGGTVSIIDTFQGATRIGQLETSTDGTDGGYFAVWTKVDGGSLTEKFRIKNNGNVGIGTTNPAHKLQVVGGSVAIPAVTTSTSVATGALILGDGASVGIGLGGDGRINAATTNTFAAGSEVFAHNFVQTFTGGTSSSASRGFSTVATFNTSSDPGNRQFYGLYGGAFYSISSSVNSGGTYQNFLTANNDSATRTVEKTYGLNVSSGSGRVGGTVTEAVGVNIAGLGSGTTTTFKGLQVINIPAAGTQYGIYLENMTGGSTANYGIYSVGGNNYFGGNVGIGSTNPSAFKLEVAGNIGPEADNTRDLGSASKRFANLYATTINGALTPTGFTEGSVVFATTGGTLAQDNSNFFWNNSQDRLGIGTASPTSAVHIRSTSAFPTLNIESTQSGGGLLQLTSSTNNWQMYNGGGKLQWDGSTTAGVELTLDSAGNVGIGTTAPNYPLELAPASIVNNGVGINVAVPTATVGTYNGLRAVGAVTGILQAIIENSAVSTSAHARLTLQTDDAAAGDPYTLYRISGLTDWSVGMDNSDSDKFKISQASTLGSSDRFTILTTGEVGIGTTDPTAKLFVRGVNTGGPGSGAQLSLGDAASLTTGKQLQLGYDTTSDYGWIQPVNWASGYKNLALQMNGGNVGIGTTNPGSLLHVETNASAGARLTLKNTSASANFNAAIEFNAVAQNSNARWTIATGSTDDSANAGDLYFRNTVQGRGSLLLQGSTGYVGIGTTNPTSPFHVAASGATTDYVARIVNTQATRALGLLVQTNTASATTSDPLLQVTGGSDVRFKVETGGNVGIGTVSPGTAFATLVEVAKSDTSGQPIFMINNSAAAGSNRLSAMRFILNGVSNLLVGHTGGGAVIGDATAQSFIASQVAGEPLTFFTAGIAAANERMRIDGSGNVGIGTTNPGTKFQVSADKTGLTFNGGFQMNITGTTDPLKALLIGIDTTNNYALLQATRIGFSTYPIIIQPSGGNVGIGTTNPSNLLSLKPATNVAQLYLEQNNATDGWTMFADSSDGKFTISRVGTQAVANAFNIAMTTGNVGIGTTAGGAKLDVRDGNIILTDADVAHGITDVLPTAAFGGMSISSATNGGMDLNGISDTGTALALYGTMGDTDPNDAIPALLLAGMKKSGTARQALGAAETVFQIRNFSTNLITGLGSGNIGIGTTNPSNPLHVVGAGRFSANVAIGGAVETTIGLDVTGSITTSADQIGTRIYPSFSSAATGSGTGVLARVATATASYTMNNAYALFAQTPAIGAGSAITNNYGLFIADQDPAGVTNGYGIYQNTATNLNYFAGNVGIGSTNPGTTLDLARTNADSIIRSVTTTTGLSRLDLRGHASGTTLPGFLHQGGANIILTNKTSTDGNFTSIFNQSDAGAQRSGIAFINDTQSSDASSIAFLTHNGTAIAEQMRVNASGSVSIGTTTASTLGTGGLNRTLNLHQASGNGLLALSTDVTADGSVTGQLVFGTTGASTGKNGISIYGMLSGSAATNASSDLHFALRDGATIADKMIIKSAGNVGIGTTDPTARLHVTSAEGTVTMEGNSNCTTSGNNVMMLRSDVASADDPVFRVQCNGATFADGAYTGTGADFAEYFETSDTTLQAGEVVSLDVNQFEYIKRSTQNDSQPVIGVISTKPSFVANGMPNLQEASLNYKPVALAGRVPVKVSEENGQIHTGDRLTVSSQIPGYAAKLATSGQSIGIALEDSNGGSNGTDTIIVFVNLGYQKVDVAQNSEGELVAMEEDLDLGGNAILNVKSIASMSGKWSISDEGLLVAKEIHTEKLCVGLTCVTEEELKTLLQTAGINNSPGDNSGGDEGGAVSGENTPPPSEEEPPTDPGTGEEPPPTEETPPADEGAEPPPAEDPPPTETPAP